MLQIIGVLYISGWVLSLVALITVLIKYKKKMKRIMAGYREFLLLPEIRPLHIEFVERRRAEQLQRQQEEERQRQEQEARDRERRQAHFARGMRMR